MIRAWLVGLAFALGAWTLAAGDLRFLSLFLLVGYGALTMAVVASVRGWRDLLNPLLLVAVSGAIRFTIPAIVVSLGFGQATHQELFRLMGLQDFDWKMGHVLALTGMLGVALGWFLVRGRAVPEQQLRRHVPNEVLYGAVGAVLIGFTLLVVFVRSNASDLTQTITEGTFRSTQIQQGTGVFFYLALMLIVGAVVLAAWLMERGRRWWIVLSPAVFCGAAYFVLGGRARALVAPVCVAVLFWYAHREANHWRPHYLRPILWTVLVLAPLAMILAAAVLFYRSGEGLSGVLQAFTPSGIERYLGGPFLVDFGALHALAGGAHIGPGVLHGQTFAQLTWPFTSLFHLQTRSAALYLVSATVGFGSRPWSLSPGLFGDAYVNLSVMWTLAVTVIFGVLLKVGYVRFRTGRLHAVVYVLLLAQAMRMYLETIEKWRETLFFVLFAILIMRGPTWFLGRRERRRERHALAPGPLTSAPDFAKVPAPEPARVTVPGNGSRSGSGPDFGSSRRGSA